MSPKPNTNPKADAELDPEWTEFESAWAVEMRDFPSLDDASQFLLRRREIFFAAQKVGIPKELLVPFEPNKPGFEKRARTALTALNKLVGWAAQ